MRYRGKHRLGDAAWEVVEAPGRDGPGVVATGRVALFNDARENDRIRRAAAASFPIVRRPRP